MEPRDEGTRSRRSLAKAQTQTSTHRLPHCHPTTVLVRVGSARVHSGPKVNDPRNRFHAGRHHQMRTRPSVFSFTKQITFRQNDYLIPSPRPHWPTSLTARTSQAPRVPHVTAGLSTSLSVLPVPQLGYSASGVSCRRRW